MKEEKIKLVINKEVCIDTVRETLIGKFMMKREYSREEIADTIEKLFKELL